MIITKEMLDAVHTQYQLTIEPRASNDAPTLAQMQILREIHFRIDKLVREHDDLNKKFAITREALEFYANNENYDMNWEENEAYKDEGSKAKQALKEINNETL